MSEAENARRQLSVMLLCSGRDERDHLSALIMKENHRLCCAEQLDEALEYLNAGITDVTIVSNYPGAFDGFAAALTLREHLPSLQTAVVGDAARKEQLQDSLNAGATAYLERPVEAEKLADALARMASLSPNKPGSACPYCSVADNDPRCGVIHVDAEGMIMYANSAAKDQLQNCDLLDAGRFRHVAGRAFNDYRGNCVSNMMDAVAGTLHWRGELAGMGTSSACVYDCEVIPAPCSRGRHDNSLIIRDISTIAAERDRLAFDCGVASDLLLLAGVLNSTRFSGTSEDSSFKLATIIDQAFSRSSTTSFKPDLPPHIPQCYQGSSEHTEAIFLGLAAHLHTLTGISSLTMQVSLKETNGDSVRLYFELSGFSSAVGSNGYQSAEDYIGSLEKPDGSGLQAQGIFLAAARIGENGESLRVKRFLHEKIIFSFCLRMTVADSALVPEPLREPETTGGGARLWTVNSGRSAQDKWRVLVADDSLVDQISIRAMIEKAGHESIVFVGNGREAVEEFEQGEYDLIFMDILMPVMDGFEATRLIRQQERLSGRHTTVIALTSYSLKAVHDKCISVGMDGYLSKPVTMKNMESLFSRLASGEPAPDRAPESAGKNQAPVLDAAGMLKDYGGDIDLYRSIAGVFESQAQPVLSLLEEALSGNDLPKAGTAAHKLKGIASALGGKRFSDLLRTIDDAARNETPLDCCALHQQVLAEYDLLKSAISRMDWNTLKRMPQ